MFGTGQADVALPHPQEPGGPAEQNAVGTGAERVGQTGFLPLPRGCVFRTTEQGAAVTTEHGVAVTEDAVDRQGGGRGAGGGSIEKPVIDPCLSVGIGHGGEEIPPPLGGGDTCLVDRAETAEGGDHGKVWEVVGGLRRRRRIGMCFDSGSLWDEHAYSDPTPDRR
jgi:hypothetical protein